jgi:hypothetical protein
VIPPFAGPALQPLTLRVLASRLRWHRQIRGDPAGPLSLTPLPANPRRPVRAVELNPTSSNKFS